MVRGAVGLARRMGMSPLIIGLTVIAIGTSAPELVTTVTATLEGAPDLALGNVVGSNLANMLLILGVAALLRPIACTPKVIWRDGSMVLAATVLFVGIAMTGIFVLWHGLVLVAALFVYLYLTYRAENANIESGLHGHEASDVSGVPERVWTGAVYLLGGLAGTVIGAKLLVDGGVSVGTGPLGLLRPPRGAGSAQPRHRRHGSTSCPAPGLARCGEAEAGVAAAQRGGERRGGDRGRARRGRGHRRRGPLDLPRRGDRHALRAAWVGSGSLFQARLLAHVLRGARADGVTTRLAPTGVVSDDGRRGVVRAVFRRRARATNPPRAPPRSLLSAGVRHCGRHRERGGAAIGV